MRYRETGKHFNVEREWPFCWAVVGSWKYSGLTIARFWTEGAAQEVADRLNWFMEEHPKRMENERVYDEHIYGPDGAGPVVDVESLKKEWDELNRGPRDLLPETPKDDRSVVNPAIGVLVLFGGAASLAIDLFLIAMLCLRML